MTLPLFCIFFIVCWTIVALLMLLDSRTQIKYYKEMAEYERSRKTEEMERADRYFEELFDYKYGIKSNKATWSRRSQLVRTHKKT